MPDVALPNAYRPLNRPASGHDRAGGVRAAYNSRPMSNRSRRRDAARAEARRRFRDAARGIDAPEAERAAPSQPAGPGRPQGFLTRLFPPAPPLRGRPDPLADFRYAGPARPVVAGLYLLARNPLAWIVPGVVWALAQSIDPRTLAGLFASLVSFAALIAAGWFGWQRPPVFGAAAATLGVLTRIAIGFVQAAVAREPVLPAGTGPAEVAVTLVAGLALYGLIGLLSGWYGGYLRRRQAQVGAERQASTRRR